MWRPDLEVIARRAGEAIHVLDRFHIMANMNKAIDKVRAAEAKRLKADGYEPVLFRSAGIGCTSSRQESIVERIAFGAGMLFLPPPSARPPRGMNVSQAPPSLARE